MKVPRVLLLSLLRHRPHNFNFLPATLALDKTEHQHDNGQGYVQCFLAMARGSKQSTASKAKPSPKDKARRINAAEQKVAASNGASLDLQQRCLDLFRDALGSSEAESDALQEVKKHLFNRDFAQAFGKESYLRAYAGRWSPSRALAYHQVLADVQDEILATLTQERAESGGLFRVVCIGGGAGGELAALATWLRTESQNISNPNRPEKVHATLLDIARWDSVVSKLHNAVTIPPVLSAYASAAMRVANEAMLSEEAYSVTFEQMDALSITEAQCKAMVGNADLVTMMFTLNELYSTSVPKTQQMLARITAAARPGSHLLVVDSPGSYSTVSLNGADKNYPMQWLLDLTLVGTRKRSDDGETTPKWEKLITDESRWFRLPPGLKYAIELENCRYQIHLYRRLLGD